MTEITLNMTELVEIETGIKRKGFIDYDRLQSKYIYVYFDNEKNSWSSNTLGHFKPEAEKYTILSETISEEKQNVTSI